VTPPFGYWIAGFSLLAKGDRVKQIIAVVKPIVVGKVVAAVSGLPILDMIVIEAKGFGRQKSYLQQYGESEYSLAFLPKVEMLIWVEDQYSDQIVRAIVTNSRTGRIGDGKILVLPAYPPSCREIDF